MSIKILAVGDVCGEPGLAFLAKNLRALKKQMGVDFTVVNGENANVIGVTPRQADEIFKAGADVVTLGNHTWGRTEIRPYLDDNPRIIRPANFAPQCPGRGVAEVETGFGLVCVASLIGRYSIDPNVDNPFLVADDILDTTKARVVLFEYHAEGTSEKRALGFYLDGRASALWGTHTHVQTSDAQVLPDGTGYITDLGMTGPINSVLGIRPEISIGKFLGDPPCRFESAPDPSRLEACLFDIDPDTGGCLGAEAIRIR